MSVDVFLSHSHVDKVFADAICHRLEAADIRCWVAPRDIRPGDDWAEAIIDAMDHARMLVLVFSASANNSPQVRREVERAVNKGLMVLPFRIENVPLSKSLEYFISTQHWLDAITGDLEVHLDELCRCVAMLLGRLALPAEAPAAPPPAPVCRIATARLDAIERALAQELGPIARHLLRRALQAGPTQPQLVAALAQEIDGAAERQRFIARCHAAA
ncbi:toll/interleukin-1 receptor domain-containing protein [Rugamonas sp. A1-17]|nr:toll/interleukin-1 receptor domain-containing protein [Rugamonas sp. A1-17]